LWRMVEAKALHCRGADGADDTIRMITKYAKKPLFASLQPYVH